MRLIADEDSWNIQVSSAVVRVPARAIFRRFAVTLNSWIDQSGSMNPGVLGNASAQTMVTIDVLRKRAWGGTVYERIVHWTPLFDWEVQGGLYEFSVPVGHLPTRKGWVQWMTHVRTPDGAPYPLIEQYDQVKVRMRMSAKTKVWAGPWASADASLELSGLNNGADVELDSY